MLPQLRVVAWWCCAWLGFGCGATSVYADAPQTTPRGFADLPEQVRREISLGEPRSSDQIASSPFGTTSVACFEHSPPGAPPDMPRVIAAAGYKWVGEYMQANWAHPPRSPAEVLAWSRVPDGCIDYIVRLQAHGIRVVMRLDPLPTTKLIGREPATAEELALARAYTRNVVAQLKLYVDHWQLANEPNAADAAEGYVRVFAELARAVRAEHPKAVILGPGVAMLQCMANEPYPWLAHALRAGLLSHIDIFSFHPYRADDDPPESASQFARFRHWKSYAAQIDSLRAMLVAAGARRGLPLAVTEDGQGTPVSANGEQRVTPLIDAKHELRRSLLDFAQGFEPRLHFTFFRRIPDVVYDYQGSFNTMTRHFELRPLYYAAQNLHAVLDSSCKKTDAVHVAISAVREQPALAPDTQIQTYVKRHEGFDELLIFFWAPVFAENMHVRRPIRLQVSDGEWEAPILIDLMTMPGYARPISHLRSTHVRTTFPVATREDTGLRVDGLELRDYPQLLKLIRVSGGALPTKQ